MDLFQDFRELLAAFAASRVEYVLIGGYAVVFHGRPRATKDLDLLVSLDGENRERLVSALGAFGAPKSVVEDARNLTSTEVLYFGESPVRVDILGAASGIDFAGVYERAVRADFQGVPVRVIAIDDLITNKRASGRPRDLEDCAELERVRAKLERAKR
jgi:hypothetical protein